MAAEIDTFTNLAVIYVMQGRLDDARAAVAEGRSKFPDNGKLAATHRVLSQMTEADLAAERVRRGVELISGGDVAAGIDELQTALTIDPGHVAAYIQLGVVHQATTRPRMPSATSGPLSTSLRSIPTRRTIWPTS